MARFEYRCVAAWRWACRAWAVAGLVVLAAGCERTGPAPVCPNPELEELLSNAAEERSKIQPSQQEAPPCDASIDPFAADETWSFITAPLAGTALGDPDAVVGEFPNGTHVQITGLGMSIFDVTIALASGTDGELRELCRAVFNDENRPSFTLQEADFHLQVDFVDAREDTECSVRISGSIEPCPTRELVNLVLDEFALETEQQIVVCGHEMAATPLYLYRDHWPVPCETTPTGLPEGSWGATMVIEDRADLLVNLIGTGNVITSASILQTSEDGSVPLCSGEPPSGLVSFDGAELRLDMGVPEVTDGSGDATPGDSVYSCTLSFRGSPTGCTIDAAPLAVPGVFLVLPFEGTGQYVRGSDQAAIGSITILGEAPDSDNPFVGLDSPDGEDGP